MFRTLLLSLVFWLLTLTFPSINIVGFWTIIGVVFCYGLVNFGINVLFALIVLPLRFFTLGIAQIFINVGVLYLLATWFPNFTIAEGVFWWVFFFSTIYVTIKSVLVD